MDIGEIEFSGPTYQVQVDEEFWPFVQFDEEGEIKDAFCTCESEKPTCEHLEAAITRIYNGQTHPLHIRFAESFWNAVCKIFFEKQLTKVELGHYVLDTVSHKRLVSIKGDPAWLAGVIENRVRETEQNSLKFSGLSYEELTLWREGRPSKELRYELSFWADLAKKMMLLQEEGAKYTIAFEYAPGGLPNQIKIAFPGLSLEFYLSEANLPEIIPTLSTVNSPLAVHHFQDGAIEEIRYDKASGTLHIRAKSRGEGPPQEGIPIDEWLFVPGKGFYSGERHSLLEQTEIGPDQLGGVLNDHAKVIAAYLPVHLDPIRPQYSLSFDEQWNLHIASYLFEPGDARFFDGWAYVDNDGFYPLETRQPAQVVPEEEVSSFVHSQRIWLNTQEGFHTHLTTVESQLSYKVEDSTLTLEGQVEMPEGKDFGEWVYIEGQGFYSKARGRAGSPVRSGTVVSKEDIPLFLQVNQDDLEMIEGFFLESCPVEKGMLKLSVSPRGDVVVKPIYTLLKGVSRRDVEFFDNYAYVKDQGFSLIPQELRLPERFREQTTLKGEELRLFLNYEIDAFKPYISSLDHRLQKADDLELSIRDAEQQAGQIRLHLVYTSSQGSVPVSRVWETLEKGKSYLISEAGLIDLNAPRFQWLKQVPENQVVAAENEVNLTTLEFMRLNVLEDPKTTPGSRAHELVTSLTSLQAPDAPDLARLKSTLRPYQQQGVNWLWFLYRNLLSGLLCDDMGLGKTHQAMALIAAARKDTKHLVVCPTSVIYHWKEKLAEFLPDMRVTVFYGPQRNLKKLEKADILVTSYGVLRSEKAKLSKIPFELAIYDEIQVAKNASSQTHVALTHIQARMRLGLTGTPIENNLRELKSLFDLVLPTYFPSMRQFRDSFILPIERDQDQARKILLRRIISPFLLRRKKEEVLTDLPEKTEEKAHCDLSSSQRRLYNEVLLQSKDRLLEELQDEGKPASYVHVFALLTHLKQICDHPAVYYKEPDNHKNHDSGKWQLFLELLSQARESRQKVVVFSQYLFMLDIIEAHLKEHNIGYAAVRGSTGDRETPLRCFKEDPRCEVFVGSLQAIGLGVDLTSASVVIHYDRWWNAARENQATDRVHRIGQTRGVQVFKLLTLNTLEERIDELITKKGRLMEEVVGSEQAHLKSFTKEELMELLALASEPD